MFKLYFEKAKEPEIKLPTSVGSSKKTREFQKNIYFCFIDCAKAFGCVDHNNLWKILKEMEIPVHLTCLLRNLYAGQEATVRTGHGNRLGPNRKRIISKLYVFTLLIELICRVHQEKHWAGGSTSWNQDCQEKYQYPEKCRWHHPYGRQKN